MEIQDAAGVTLQGTHSMWRAFHHKNFRLFFTGQTISLLGTWSQTLAISWLVWGLTHSAVWLGIIGFMIQFPVLIFGLPGGALADRFDRLRGLVTVQALCMLQAVALAILTLTGKIELWQVFALSAMLGTIYSLEYPLRQAFVMDIVGRQDLLNAVSLNSAMFHATRGLGPVVAGFIVAWQGEGICFLFNAATFAFLIAALMFVDRSKISAHGHEPNVPMIRSIREGLGYLKGEPHSKLGLLLVGVASVAGMPFIYLLPIFADKVFGGSSVELGWLMGASGLGAFAGAMFLASRKPGVKLLSLSAGSFVIFSLAIIAFSFISNILIALPLLSVAGFFLTIVLSGTNTLIQHRSPDHMRGRVIGLFSTTFMGLAPFGSLLGGFVAEKIGAPLTVTICGGASAIAGIVMWYKARKLDKGHS